MKDSGFGNYLIHRMQLGGVFHLHETQGSGAAIAVPGREK
jgi:hypothetical protein